MTTSSEADAWGLGFERLAQREPVATKGLFDVEVLAANEFRLIPRTELAKSLIAMWTTHGTVQRSHTPNITAGCFKFTHAPMLSSGGDPFMAGMAISPEERDACKKLIGRSRAKAARERRRALKQPVPPKAKKRKP